MFILCFLDLSSSVSCFVCVVWWGLGLCDPSLRFVSCLLVGPWHMCDLRPCAFLICLLFCWRALGLSCPFLCPAFLVWRSLVTLPLSPTSAPLCLFLICLFCILLSTLLVGLGLSCPYLCPAFLVWRSFFTLPLSPTSAPLCFLDLSLSASFFLLCCWWGFLCLLCCACAADAAAVLGVSFAVLVLWCWFCVPLVRRLLLPLRLASLMPGLPSLAPSCPGSFLFWSPLTLQA